MGYTFPHGTRLRAAEMARSGGRRKVCFVLIGSLEVQSVVRVPTCRARPRVRSLKSSARAASSSDFSAVKVNSCTGCFGGGAMSSWGASPGSVMDGANYAASVRWTPLGPVHKYVSQCSHTNKEFVWWDSQEGIS
jgi:hypothetical protein